jgi:hypothetical protein
MVIPGPLSLATVRMVLPPIAFLNHRPGRVFVPFSYSLKACNVSDNADEIDGFLPEGASIALLC